MIKSNTIRESTSRKVFRAFNMIFLTFVCLIFIIPIWNVLITSVAKDIDVMGSDYLLVPRSFTLQNYWRVLNSGYMGAFKNSLKVAVLGTIFSMLITVPMGFALSQKHLLGRSIIMKAIVFTMVFDVGIMPFYIVVRSLGLINKTAAIIIPVGLSTFNLIILKNYMGSIPVSLLESAKLDGCNDATILLKIVLPLSVSILAAVILFYFVSYWNRYFEVIMFINDSRKYTLQVVLRSLMFESDDSLGGGQYVYNNLKMAVMVLGMLPVLIIYPFVQKHFVSGIMLGGVKG
ncbi:MAG: L-arabinose transport system permease protein AraQ [Spirochaetes bacterium ADurb.Bin315]|jgi:putative aldouronate transport system permease protein|nr:carbohydrate ABC transporter permease [Spirochaetota bacterium]OQA43831.1 MAG: L-arabinose transport system permease protein AraQ [Spirochaetes bacterium ADurb.Bin315]HOE88829.1 carbohydrate ABC transporter permease [Sphaerochaeta sp.]HOR79484.1 carbohydrate ABC transporter permease [Sphaerochaeta sp.]HPK64117.1 carbohydrate ABC transporter permease [Sphaerochaeta sp.]